MKELNVNYEVIVVDDDSKDDTEQMVKEEFPKVKLIKHDSELLPCRCIFEAIEISVGRYIVRIDDDNEIDKNCIKQLLDCIAKDHRIAFCGAMSFGPDGKTITNMGSVYSKFLKRAGKPNWSYSNSNSYDVDLVDNVYIFKKSLINLSVFEKLCSLFPWSLEDAYYQLLSKRNGFRVVVNPTAQTIHYRPKRKTNYIQIKNYMRSKIIWIKVIQKTNTIVLLLQTFFFFFATLFHSLTFDKRISIITRIFKSLLEGAIEGLRFVANSTEFSLFD